MQNATHLGLNRTGADMSPLDIQSMQSYADDNSPAHLDDPVAGPGLTAIRSEYILEAERIGSVPLPASLSGTVTTGVAKLTGKNPEVLIDKLGERLAFERTGVRLYQALIDKVSTFAEPESLPFSLADLERIRDQELEHMHLLVSVIDDMGADPTAETPCADVAGVTAGGVMQTLTDPRTSIAQCLMAILTAELTDHSGWTLLVELGKTFNRGEEVVEQFRAAHQHEEQHVQLVQQWLSRIVLEEATA